MRSEKDGIGLLAKLEYITYTFAERPNAKTGTFQNEGIFSAGYAMFYHSVVLPVPRLGIASTSH